MIGRLTFLVVAATVALMFSVATVAALLWGKRSVVWQVHRSERELWRAKLIQWRVTRDGP